jgi:choline dehydrogenase-like flavoprotein
LLRIPAALVVWLFGSGTIFAGHVEDLPYPDNRVAIDLSEADGVTMKYTIRDELRDRVGRQRDLLKKHLGGRRTFFLSHDVELNYGHPCGTCAMGDDPRTSVVSRDCRAHGVANLFITDASFMPTSGATNPALTIAANALRVSEAIHRLLTHGNEDGNENDTVAAVALHEPTGCAEPA